MIRRRSVVRSSQLAVPPTAAHLAAVRAEVVNEVLRVHLVVCVDGNELGVVELAKQLQQHGDDVLRLGARHVIAVPDCGKVIGRRVSGQEQKV